MINIPKLLRHSIERQKSRPNSELRQLIYEKTRLAIKSKLNEMNAPDFVQRSYMLRLEAAICEVEASYLLRPEYFVLEENRVPCHFAYRAYLPDYFGTRRNVAVDPGRLRQLASGHNMSRYLSFENNEPSMLDAGLFDFGERKAAPNRAQGLTDNPHFIDFAARRASRQGEGNQSPVINNRDLSRERNLYVEDDNEIEAFIEGRQSRLNPASGRQTNLQSVNARNLFPEAGEQQISHGQAWQISQGETLQNMPRQQNFQRGNTSYNGLSGSATNGSRQSSFNTGNAPSLNRQATIEGGQSSPLNGERGERPSVNNINRFREAGVQAGRDGPPRPMEKPMGNPQASINATKSSLPNAEISKRQPKKPSANALRSQPNQAISGAGMNDGKRAPSAQQAQQSPKAVGYGNAFGYAAAPNVYFFDKTVAAAQFSVSNQPNPVASRKMPVDEQIKELERRLFKRETVVNASPLPRPIISASSGSGLSNGGASATGMNGRSPEQKIFIAPFSDKADNSFIKSPFSYPSVEGRASVGTPSGSLFSNVPDDAGFISTQPVQIQAVGKEVKTGANPASEIKEPLSRFDSNNSDIAYKAPLNNEAKKASSNIAGENINRNQTPRPQTHSDNGNLFTFNDIELESEIPDEEAIQSFLGNNSDVLEDEPPIPDFIVKYDKREADQDADLFDQRTNNKAASDENANRNSLLETRSQSKLADQTQPKQLEQDLFPKILSFDARRQKRFKRQSAYKALSLAIHENFKGKGSLAAGILAACVLSSGVYYFWRGNVPVFSSINIGDSKKFDLSHTSAINSSGSGNQATQAESLTNENHNGANPEAGKTLSKASSSAMSSRPLEERQKDTGLPSVVVNPNGVQSSYQQAMLEPSKTNGLDGVNPQNAQIQTRPRADANILLKEKNGQQRKLPGSVAWTLRPPHSAENPYDETALVADFTTQDGLFGVRMSIRKNYHENLDATHLIDLSFSKSGGGNAGSVADVRGIYFGDKTNVLNNQASTTIANLYEDNFVASLRLTPNDKDYNEKFLGHAAVFGFPATFNDGKTALFVLNKGPQDQELFDKFNEKNTH